MRNAGYMTRVHGYLVPVGSSVGDGVKFNFLGTNYAWNIRFDETYMLTISAVQTD